MDYKNHFAVKFGDQTMYSFGLSNDEASGLKQALPQGAELSQLQPEAVWGKHLEALRTGDTEAADKWLSIYSEMEKSDCNG